MIDSGWYAKQSPVQSRCSIVATATFELMTKWLNPPIAKLEYTARTHGPMNVGLTRSHLPWWPRQGSRFRCEMRKNASIFFIYRGTSQVVPSCIRLHYSISRLPTFCYLSCLALPLDSSRRQQARKYTKACSCKVLFANLLRSLSTVQCLVSVLTSSLFQTALWSLTRPRVAPLAVAACCLLLMRLMCLNYLFVLLLWWANVSGDFLKSEPIMLCSLAEVDKLHSLVRACSCLPLFFVVVGVVAGSGGVYRVPEPRRLRHPCCCCSCGYHYIPLVCYYYCYYYALLLLLYYCYYHYCHLLLSCFLVVLLLLLVLVATAGYIIIVFSFWFLLSLMINDLSCFVGVLVYVGCSGDWNSWIWVEPKFNQALAAVHQLQDWGITVLQH